MRIRALYDSETRNIDLFHKRTMEDKCTNDGGHFLNYSANISSVNLFLPYVCEQFHVNENK